MRMMRNFAGIAMAVLFVSVPAGGQVVPVQSGRLLDASHQVGSGGYNSSTSNTNSAVNSQLYVTGQVTGLSGFHGHVPYSATNVFQGNAPSASLSSFTGRSVGLQDAVGSNTYRANSFFDPTRATANALQPTASLASPGSTQAMQMNTPNSMYATKMYMDAVAAYGPIMTSEYGTGSALAPGKFTAPDGSALSGKATAEDAVATVSRPGAAALFGVVNARERLNLAGELYEMELADDRLQIRSTPGGESEPGEVRSANTTGRPGAINREKEDESRSSPLGTPRMKNNMDVFTDVLVRMQEQRTGSERPGATRNTPENTGVKARPIYEAGEKPKNIFGDEMPAEPRKIVEVRDRNIVMHGLAGTSSNDFNVHMTRAEKKLRAGKFYDAAGDYEIAIAISPRNPLPHVGLAMALTGAGEPLSAGVYLRRAMELFPPIMETRIDIGAMMDKELIARRLATLKKRLDDKTQHVEPLLLFLEVFMARNAGDDAIVRRYVPRLQESAGTDRILGAYADFLATGKKPQVSSRPASVQPASAPAAAASPTPLKRGS